MMSASTPHTQLGGSRCGKRTALGRLAPLQPPCTRKIGRPRLSARDYRPPVRDRGAQCLTMSAPPLFGGTSVPCMHQPLKFRLPRLKRRSTKTLKWRYVPRAEIPPTVGGAPRRVDALARNTRKLPPASARAIPLTHLKAADANALPRGEKAPLRRDLHQPGSCPTPTL